MKSSVKAILSAALAVVSAMAFPSVANAQKGQSFVFRLTSSEIYPGTERRISVYVPECYDASSPACLVVGMDYIDNTLLCAIDNLVASGEMPVSIAVGIEPGTVYDENHEEAIRFNRSNEFDRVDGTFASFLEKEVIPALKQQTAPSGLPILVSDRAADRAIMGYSSGAIAAFNAAWQRPDLFSRVYSIIGTYVPFRYGDQIPGIIRKTEPKRLRVFFQDNSSDSWNLIFGSWFEENRLMLSAMEYAGYEVDHQWDEGGHTVGNGFAIVEDVMRWLWKGWPDEVGCGKSANPTLDAIIDPSSGWQKLRSGIPSGSVLKPVDGESEPKVVSPGRKFDPLTAFFPGGKIKAQAKAGSCWVKTSIKQGKGFKFEQEFYCLHAPASQICYDTNGYLYCASPVGIQICDHNGRVRAILSLDCGEVEAVAFSGNKIYAISAGSLWVRTLKTSGFVDAETVPYPKRESQS